MIQRTQNSLLIIFVICFGTTIYFTNFNPGSAEFDIGVISSHEGDPGPAPYLELSTDYHDFPGTSLINSGRPSPTSPGVVGMSNPAAIYCQELGYQYKIDKEDQGDRGVCILPNDQVCDEWAFLQGECGQAYNYCAREGMLTAVMTDGEKPLSPSYASCLDHTGREVGPVIQLMALDKKSLGCGAQQNTPASRSAPPPKRSLETLDFSPPAAFDWRNHQNGNWLTPIRNQAQCGSCWAFAAVGVTEALYNIANYDPDYDLNLSEQYLVSDCYDFGYLQNCCGGWKDMALNYIRDEGIPDEDCMKYQDGTSGKDGSTCTCQLSGTCGAGCAYSSLSECSDTHCDNDRCPDWDSRLITLEEVHSVGSWIWLPTDDEMKQALIEHGPLAVSVGISTPVGGSFGAPGYAPDVYSCENDSTINHAVILVGYNDPGQYWIVRNSWGPGWNGDGYYKLAYGECFVNYDVQYGVVNIDYTFSDVFPSHWAYRYVEAIADAGLTSGYPDGTYRPENPVTRAEMAVFLLNGMGITPPTLDGSHPFSDITGHWAEGYIEELYDQGITGGYPDGTYRPENLVTRAEMAVFLLKGIGVSPPPLDSSHPFSDINLHWAEIFIEELFDQGITGGYPDGTYRPENRVTRAEMAVFLVNAFGLPMP